MSYILDALRKSEQERRRAGAPDLTTEHRPASASGRRRLLPGLLALALIGNAGVLGVWLLRSEDPRPEPPAASRAPASSSASAPEPAPATVTRAEQAAQARAADRTDLSMEEPVATTGNVASGREKAAGNEPERAAVAAPTEPVSIHDLPEQVRERIPSLRFSTHIYAEEPAWREVGINGRIVGEGARIRQLRLERITETGVILELDGWRFRVSVLESWDY